jgi:hypothetical protein
MADSSRNILLALLVVGVAVAVFYMMDPTLGGLVKEGFQDMMAPTADMPMESATEPILPPNNPPSASGMQVEKFASGPDQKKEIDGLLAASQALGKALSEAANKKSTSGFQNQVYQGANGDSVEDFQAKGKKVMKSSSGGNVQKAKVTAQQMVENFENPASANCYPKNQLAPQELLPSDQASKWAEVNPTGAGDISGKNFLSAGALIGVNTVGQSLRNANQQLRSEPPCPQVNVSIWNNSTIEPDLQRRPLEGF